MAADNTYNHESDLSDVFCFHVFSRRPKDDWCWADDVVVAVARHAGGDPRGNYHGWEFHRADCLAESGFLDWVSGWHIQEAVDETGAGVPDAKLREMDERWAVGYSSSPGREVEESIQEVKSIADDRRSALVILNNGWTARLSPE